MKPYLSLITPFNGSESFSYFLKSIEVQQLSKSLFEVIVVQEKKNDCKKLIEILAMTINIKLLTLPLTATIGKHSAGPLRNFGAEYAQGEILVFIDSDCILHKECLKRHHDYHMDNSSAMLCGAAVELPVIHQSEKNLFMLSKGIRIENCFLAHDYRENNRPTDNHGVWQELYSCNASFPKSMFELVGGFDDNGFRCHDMDLSYRLFKLSPIYFYDETCLVTHIEHERSIKYRDEQIKGWLWMCEKHPELQMLGRHKIATFRSAYANTMEKSKREFSRVAHALQKEALVIDNYLLIEEPQPSSMLKKILEVIPTTTYRNSSSLRHQMRLHRDCWDFGIIHNQVEISAIPKFSVVIPFFNQIDKLTRAVKSVLKQTFQDFEIIMINDCSTERHFTVLHPLLNSKRIRIVNNQQNLGQSRSLNIGLSIARGSYLVQLDADDWFDQYALEKINLFLENNPCEAVYAKAIVVNQIEAIKGHGYQIIDPLDCFRYPHIQAPRVYNVKALKDMGGWSVGDAFSGRFYEDRLLLKRMAEMGKVCFLDEHLYYVSPNPDSLSRQNPSLVAAAKLAILVNEANKEAKYLKFDFNGRELHPQFLLREHGLLKRNWSIIICYRRNIEHLKLVLTSWMEALESSAYAKIELMIINDSGQPISLEIQQFEGILSVYDTFGNCGSAYSRNLGSKKAKNEFLFFCDEDHIVPKDVLFSHEKIHSSPDEVIAIGGAYGRRTIIDISSDLKHAVKYSILENHQFEENFIALSKSMMFPERTVIFNHEVDIYQKCFKHSWTEAWQHDWSTIFLHHSFELKDFPHAWLKCGTGNMSISNQNFKRLGGFNTEMKSMEDWEFGLKGQQQGIKTQTVPFAEPFHIIHESHPERPLDDVVATNYLYTHYPNEMHALICSSSLTNISKIFRYCQYSPTPVSSSINPIEKRILSLTFDDGPHPYTTRIVLDLLELFNVKATFFVLGEQAMQNPELIERMISAGHELGIHGWKHIPFYELSEQELFDDLLKTKNLLEKFSNVKVNLVRPPHGRVGKLIAEKIQDMGFQLIGWDTTSKDWSTGVIKEQMISSIASLGILDKVILFHDGVGDPQSLVSTLEWLIDCCDGARINFVTVGQFLSEKKLSNLFSSLSVYY